MVANMRSLSYLFYSSGSSFMNLLIACMLDSIDLTAHLCFILLYWVKGCRLTIWFLIETMKSTMVFMSKFGIAMMMSLEIVYIQRATLSNNPKSFETIENVIVKAEKKRYLSRSVFEDVGWFKSVSILRMK